jgi:hypothetical protein
MNATRDKQPLTLKGALALAGAAVLYLVASALGLDLSGNSEGSTGGAPGAGVSSAPAAPRAQRRDDSELIQQLFRTTLSDRIVEAEGVVVHVLPLDDEGDRHQVFLLELANGITLKIAHNIDLAPALPNLRKGATVRFHGEYEYNEKGGVVHWTHRDPKGRHEHGWLEFDGQRYE